jgi:hypothetical protein
VHREIVVLAGEGSVVAGKDQRIVEETVEDRDIAGELRVPELGFTRKDFVVYAHRILPLLQDATRTTGSFVIFSDDSIPPGE